MKIKKMKSKFLILILVIPMFSLSQSKLEYGLQAGGGVAKFTKLDENYMPSYHFGGYLTYSLGEKIYIKTNLIYSGLNFQNQILSLGGINDENDIEKTRLGYIQLPLSFNIISKSRNFDLGFGSSFDFLVNEKETTILHGKTSESFDTGYNHFQFGLLLELNFIVNDAISIYTNYKHNITPLEKEKSYKGEAKTMSLNLGLSYKLN